MDVLADALTELEQGVLLAALMHERAEERPAALSRLEGAWGPQCLAAYEELARLAPRARRALMAALASRLFATAPANLHWVHLSWIEHLLAEEPPLLAAVVWRGLPPPQGASGWARPQVPRVCH